MRCSTVCSVSVLVVLAMSTHARGALGQTSEAGRATAGIGGLVITSVGGAPIEGAVVSLVEAQRSATSTGSGAYQLLNVAPGTYTLSVRKIGYAPIDARITLPAGRPVDADMQLEPAKVQRLDTVAVRADSTQRGPLGLLATRMRYDAGGVFMLRAELDSARGRPMSELLRKRARGAHIVTYANRGAMLLATARGANSLSKLPQADPTDPTSPRACFCQVYLDGVRIYTPNSESPAPDLGRYDAGSFEAVEYYPGPATTPLEYGGDGAACGTLLLWTRAR